MGIRGLRFGLIGLGLWSCVSDAPVGGDASMDSSNKPAGTEGAPCLPGNQCVSGLLCLSDFCVRPPEGGTMEGGGMDAGGGGMDCGAFTKTVAIACGQANCDPVSGQACCMSTKGCFPIEAGSCSQPWRCNQHMNCFSEVCCYVNGGTMGGCPITTTQSPQTKCVASAVDCETTNQGRILCASDSDCAGSSVSTKCKPMLDPGGNIVGICSP